MVHQRIGGLALGDENAIRAGVDWTGWKLRSEIIRAFEEISRPLIGLTRSNDQESQTISELPDTLPELLSGQIKAPVAAEMAGAVG